MRPLTELWTFLENTGLYLGLLIGGVSGVLIGALFGILREKRRIKKQISALDLELEQLMRGKYQVDFSHYQEGEFHILAGQLEQVKKRTEHLVEQLTKEKKMQKDFIADISHQLKTPLTAQLTYLEYLEETEPNDKRQEQLGRCVMLAQEMNQLIRDLLDAARLEVSAVKMQITPHYLLQTVQHAVDLVLAETKQEKETIMPEITLRIPEQLQLRYDEKWLEQAVLNLLKNACSYSGKQPKVVISTEQSETFITIVVADNGEGIESSELPHIFERFYRAKNNAAGGVGIGLSLAAQIIEAHHGTIRAESGKTGTRFLASLPRLNCVEKTER